MRNPIAIVGAAESDYGRVPNRTELDLHAQAAERALAQAGIGKDEVDGLFSLTQAYVRTPDLLVAEYLGIRPTYQDSTSAGGSSFEILVEHAMSALQARRCDVALITYGSVLRSAASRKYGTDTDSISDIAQQYEEPYGLSLISSYALAAARHMHEFGTSSEQLAEVAVTMREHARLNPRAMYRDPLTVNDVLESRMISTPLHKLDCCVVSDGGGALVLVRGDRADDSQGPPIWVLGSAHETEHLHISQMPDLVRTAAKSTGERAMQEAGVRPQDVDVLTAYDSFTITLLLMLEDLGFCPKGEGGPFVEEGHIRIGGTIPTNPDGGGLSSNHPGMRGIFLLIEAVHQLRGEAGDRQIEGAEVAVAHGVGGWLSSHATVVLGRGG